MADWSERGVHLSSNRIGIVVRVRAFVIFFCVFKNRGAGFWGALLGEWSTIQRKVIYFDTLVSHSA
jgi:hypothetical protein